jgi:hypothetical protein
MMKWKFKAVVAAAALALVGPAHATIADSTTGNGELFFSIYDTASQTSYTRDLGVTVDSFVTAPGGTTVSAPAFLSFAADSTLSSFLGTFGSTASLLWNIGAMDGVGNHRYLTTAPSMPGASGASPTLTNAALTVLKSADVFVSNTNTLGTHPGTTAVNGSNTASVSINGADFFAGGASWGNNWGGKGNFTDTTTGLNTASLFWLLFTNPAGAVNSSVVRSQYAQVGTWNLASNGDLTFGTQVAAVPVPAAVWLLGSGLFGLVGVARRRQGKLAA